MQQSVGEMLNSTYRFSVSCTCTPYTHKDTPAKKAKTQMKKTITNEFMKDGAGKKTEKEERERERASERASDHRSLDVGGTG